MVAFFYIAHEHFLNPTFMEVDLTKINGSASADNQTKTIEPREVKLPSGKIARIRDFLGKDIREAQKVADGEAGSLIFAIIATTTTIDGKGITMEDVDAMAGLDALELMKQFGTNFTSAPSK
jgi:hypothetical protein